MCAAVTPDAEIDQVTIPTVVGAVDFTALASCTMMLNRPEPAPPPEPVVPAVPTVPAVPVVPPRPAAPVVPPRPADPVVPAVPTVPAEPVVPAVPTVPAEPVVPAVPTVPAEPVVPAVPTVPAVPVVPAVPTVPAEPVVPAVPTVPAVPVPPFVPAEPEPIGSLSDGAQPANRIRASERSDLSRRRMRKPPRWGRGEDESECSPTRGPSRIDVDRILETVFRRRIREPV